MVWSGVGVTVGKRSGVIPGAMPTDQELKTMSPVPQPGTSPPALPRLSVPDLVVPPQLTGSPAPAAHGPGPATGMTLDDSIYNRLLRERIIFLGSEVKDANANAICAQLLLLDAEDSDRDIWLYINSPGGSVDSGMAIYDTMQFIRSDVATVSMGLAASMGQVLLCAGAAGKRYALPHSRIMMHQASGGIGGTASDIRIQAEQAILLKRDMARLIAEHTGQTFEQIELDFERDRWFTAQQAKEYGFVDHVVRSAGQVQGGGGTD
jgi:ATP-dependent Clp protease protease subunit